MLKQCLNDIYSEMTNLIEFKIIVRKSKRQIQCTLQLMCEDCVLFIWVDLQVSLCG